MAATPEHAARVLGLDVRASMEDVRRARRELAMKYHPDRHSDVTASNRHMARVNAAVDTLIAHIQGKPKQTPKAQKPNYTDFSNTHRKKSKNCGPTEKATGRSAKTSCAQANRQAADRASRMVVTTAAVTPTSGAEDSARDNDLIRLAARSYRTVLQQISQPDRRSTVDAHALRFTTAA